MIDLDKARKVFKEYVDQFDSNNGKIRLKINHIYRVADISREIAIKINMSKEEQDLAELIGLLHDIGRFMQVKIYNTFNDGKSINHSEMGIKVLFEDGLIYKFLEDRKYDDIIRVAILNHNKDRIAEDVSGKMLDFCKIIRDADKTDIFYVLCTEDFEDSYGRTDMSQDLISDEIFREFKEDRIINYKERKSGADFMISHLAYVFDFNYTFCLKRIREKGYIEKLVNKAGFKNEDTIKKMKEIVAIANSYINEKGKE